MFELSFYPIADSYLLVAVAALALAGLLLLRPAQGTVTMRRRLLLAAVRAAVVVLVVLAMLRPTVVYTEMKTEKATLVFLLDGSRSMSVLDALAGKSRWEALRSCLADAAPALRELQREFDVKAYVFDRDVHPVEVGSDGKIALPEKPAGQETAIGAALKDVLQQEQGKRLLGVIVLTDGGHAPCRRAICRRRPPPPI